MGGITKRRPKKDGWTNNVSPQPTNAEIRIIRTQKCAIYSLTPVSYLVDYILMVMVDITETYITIDYTPCGYVLYTSPL